MSSGPVSGLSGRKTRRRRCLVRPGQSPSRFWGRTRGRGVVGVPDGQGLSRSTEDRKGPSQVKTTVVTGIRHLTPVGDLVTGWTFLLLPSPGRCRVTRPG